MSWTWQGRQLTKAVKDKTVTFTYDSEGIRTCKSDGTNTTKYLLNGTQILAQTTNSKTLCFFYDQQGNRVGMADSGNHFYYYIYNLQGDVIALADASTGKLVATYTYDAWGKIVKINGIDPNSVAESSIAKINPFRYRGYYYDHETGLYYLQSRYYDPDTGRFISADKFTSTDISGVLSTNMFAYCENNPVVRSDPTGEVFAELAAGALMGGIINVATSCASALAFHQKITPGMLVGAFASGAISGTLTFPYAGRAASIAVNSVANAAGYIAQQAIDGKKITFKGVALAAGTGAVTGAISGGGVF